MSPTKRRIAAVPCKGNSTAENTGVTAKTTTLTISVEDPKKRKSSKETPLKAVNKLIKRHELPLPPAYRDSSWAGLTAVQRANPLTMVMASLIYPDLVLIAEHFELFREVTLKVLEDGPLG